MVSGSSGSPSFTAAAAAENASTNRSAIEFGHDKALGRDAALAGISKARGDGDRKHLVEIGVSQNDERIGAAEFENHLLAVRASGRGNRSASARAAGQRYTAYPLVGDNRRHGICFDHKIEKQRFAAGRLADHLFNGLGTRLNILGMLQQGRIAGQHGRNKETKNLPERKVPRHDRQHRTERLELDLAQSCLGLCRLRRKVGRAVLGEVARGRCAFANFGNRLLQRFAHLLRDHRAVALGPLVEQLCQPGKKFAARGQRCPAP